MLCLCVCVCVRACLYASMYVCVCVEAAFNVECKECVYYPCALSCLFVDTLGLGIWYVVISFAAMSSTRSNRHHL